LETDIENIYRKVADGSLSKKVALMMIRDLRDKTRFVPIESNDRIPNLDGLTDRGADRTKSPVEPPRLSLSEPKGFDREPISNSVPQKRALAALPDLVRKPLPETTVQICHHGSGIYRIRVGHSRSVTPQFWAAIVQSLSEISKRTDARVILFSCDDQNFPGSDLSSKSQNLDRSIAQAILECEIPVIAILRGDCFDLGWLFANLCDCMICSDSGEYGLRSGGPSAPISCEEFDFFAERFGDVALRAMFALKATIRGAQFRELGIGVSVVATGEVDSRALEFAKGLAQFPRESLSLLKLHFNQRIGKAFSHIAVSQTPFDLERTAASFIGANDWVKEVLQKGGNGIHSRDPGEATSIPFVSQAVRVVAYSNGVIVATLHDGATKNAFSAALTQGIQELFDHIRSDGSYKVAVFTGSDQYFASGGTREGLLSIQKGTVCYSDAPLYETVLTCEIPVIAAMQGHAIGAGWSFGMFCDDAVFSEESIYSSRFMRYGFTPGFGSTLIFPHRFGYDLGREILFSAQDYTGRDLRERSANLLVVPRSEVLSCALERAHRLASASRETLVEAKKQRTQLLIQRLPSVIERELAMHDRTLVGNQEALEKIQANFEELPQRSDQSASESSKGKNEHSDGSFDRILTTLRETLAEELQMGKDEVEDDRPFIDMGLDSITGVTWVRRINKHFELSVTAGQVYHAPTIREFAELLLRETRQQGRIIPVVEKAPEVKSPEKRRPHVVTAPAIPVPPKPHAAPIRYPLSAGQKGLWMLQRLDPSMAAYNVPVAFKILDASWTAAIDPAIDLLLRKHSILETVIATDKSGEPFQYIPARSPIRIERQSVALTSGEAWTTFLTDAFKKPFSLNQDPLLRVQLFTDTSDHSVLLLTIHHIIFDGTSLMMLIRDFMEGWSQALHGGNTPSVSAESPAYFEFVEWENAFLKSEEAQEELAYWKLQLNGELPLLEIMTDRTRSGQQTFSGATRAAHLSASLTSRIKKLAVERKVSLFTFLLGVYKVLLYHYTRQETAIVGVPVARRPAERFETAIGYFVNMVAVKSTIQNGQTFNEFLEHLKWVVLDGLEHARYPFPKLVSELQIQPSPTHSPVFQTIFVLQNFIRSEGFDGLSGPDMPVSLMPDLHQEGEYDLRFEVMDEGGHLALSLSYNSDLFLEGTAVRFINHFINLAEAIVENPASQLYEFNYINETERNFLEQDCNRTRRDYPTGPCLHEIFETRVREFPETIAVVSGETRLTYHEIDQRSTILARYLQVQGMHPDSRVALCIRRSPEMIIGVLGVLKAGGAYVPIDPTYPSDRVTFIIEDSGAEVILTDAETAPKVQNSSSSMRTIRLDRDWSQIETESKGLQRLDRSVTSADLAYVIYTSGSTGKPKGVMIEHRQIINTLWFLQEQYPVGAKDSYLLKTNYTFDVSLSELFGWFMGQGRVVVLPVGDERLPERIDEAIRAHGITHVNFVPSALGLFLSTAKNYNRFSDKSSLKYLMVAGEALPKAMAAEAAHVFPQAKVENIYGPTETSIYASYYSCSRDPIQSVNTPIGKPIANTSLYVLNQSRRSTGIGVPGELCVAGVGLARGYLNRNELSAERFVDNPFVPGTPLYLTGDLARWLPDGTVEYLGRIDQQIKIRGYRIEPGEIEAILHHHEKIVSSVVLVVEKNGSKQLVAYYVPKAQPLDPVTLSKYVGSKLPEYMVPAHFVPLDSIPLTPSGKVNRRQLANLEFSRERKGTRIPPRGEVEEKIAAIWRNLLNLEEISTSDRFFEIGGDSLMAVMLADRISRAFDRPFSAAALFKHPTIQAIAEQFLEISLSDFNLQREPETSMRARPAATLEQRVVEKPSTSYPEYYEESLAIIGMSCQFPGTDGLDEFWKMLKEGREGGQFLSKEELSQRGVPDDLIRNPKFVPLSLAIDDKEMFDAEFFNIPGRNALLMDPQFRLLLSHAWKAVEDAGYAPEKIPQTSVFMSTGNSFYQSLLEKEGAVDKSDAYVSWVLGQGGTIPAMISYCLGLTGPSLHVHSNCSSSLAGLHLAHHSLRSGESRYALVGGATVFPASQAGYLHRPGLNFSSDGHCKAFDASADGMVGGEGVAVLLVKRAKDALEDGDPIYALIRGTGMNNDGSDKAGFYSPGVRGQSGVIRQVIKESGVDPASISYIEAHGTGTHLGDPIEVMALMDVYRPHTHRTQFCGLGSVKSNIGHADTAAGLAGCIKLALSLNHRMLPPSINYRKPNPAIDFKSSPFYVVDHLKDWEKGPTPRRAALSSFGIGGSNVHAILEEVLEVKKPVGDLPPGEPFLVVLSARNEDRLSEMMANLYRFVSDHASVFLGDIACTLATGRKAMETRVAFLAQTSVELLVKLKQAQTGAERDDGFWKGQSPGPNPTELLSPEDADAMALKWKSEGRLDKIAKLWVQGCNLDWTRLFADPRLKRVHLPAYPFAKVRHVIEARKSQEPPVAASHAVLHPLLHRNTSTLREFRFATSLSAEEFVLAHHVVQGKRILPGVAYLEMAHAAASRMMEVTPLQRIQLEEVVWLRPFSVESHPPEIRISLIPATHEKIQFEIYSESEQGERLVHSRGSAALASSETAARLNLSHLQATISETKFTGDACYEAFARAGFEYGIGFRGVQELATGRGQVIARIALPSFLHDNQSQYVLHPSILDCGLQACVGLVMASASESAVTSRSPVSTALPFALKEVKIFRPCPASVWSWVRPSAGSSANEHLQKLEIDLCDDKGEICVKLQGYSSRIVSEPAEVRLNSETLSFRPIWKEKPAGAINPDLVFAEHLVLACGVTVAELPGIQTRQIRARNQQETLGEWFIAVSGQVFELVQELLSKKLKDKTLIQLVVPAFGAEASLGAIAAMFKTARLENPNFLGQVIEVASGESASAIRQKLSTESSVPEDSPVRYAGTVRTVADWQEINNQQPLAPVPWKEGGVYVITGGAGGLGLIFARDIVEKAKRSRIIIVGRSQLSESEIEDLRLPLDQASYYAVDMAQRAEVQAFFNQVQEMYGTVNGILHSAGVIHDNFILKKSLNEFNSVLAPKVLGTVYLDLAAQALRPEFIVLFSSGVAAFGNSGQSDYATANAFMDFYARSGNLRINSTRIVSINWPLWKDGGMTVNPVQLGSLRKAGMTPLESNSGVQILYRALASHESQWMALEGDAERLKSLVSASPARVLSRLSPSQKFPENSSLEKRVIDFTRKTISEAVKCPADKIAFDTSFEKYGIDSILQVGIIEKLELATGELPKTLLFEHITLREVVDYLLREHADRLGDHFGLGINAKSTETPAVPDRIEDPVWQPAESRPNANEDIAIIGISGRYPMANSLEELWENLKAGRNCITKAHRGRCLKSSIGSGARLSADPEIYGGFLDDVDRFDHSLFDVPLEKVMSLSPEGRLYLETVWQTFEDAGYSRAALREFQDRAKIGIGVFSGTMYNQYPFSFPSVEQALLGSNATEWHIPNRVSHFFDLNGPSISVNSACSSSLLAIHMACESLKQRNCSMAIAGGVNLTLDSSKFTFLKAANMLGSGGQSRSFGAGDGYIPGEGVGAVLLKRLSDAETDGDRIHGVIKASFANHTGGRQIYTAPDPNQQARLIAESIKRSGIDPETIGYIESAVNGSRLGDPIEILALKKAFGSLTNRKAFCALGSVKSNLGHLEAASGVSQLSKVLLQFKHRTLVPSIHSHPRNPAIKLEGSPFYVQEACTPWPAVQDPHTGRELPRRCMINSFGAGGTCVNIVVEEFLPRTSRVKTSRRTDEATLLVFSAKTEKSLKTYLTTFAAYLQNHLPLDLQDVAKALSSRDHVSEFRACFIAQSIEDALQKINLLIEAQRSDERSGIYFSIGSVGNSTDVEPAPLGSNLKEWAEHWVNGNCSNLTHLYKASSPTDVYLPHYAFDHSRSFVFAKDFTEPLNSPYEEVAQRIARGELSEDEFEKFMRK
jgi:polyketide synthase PksN